MTAPPEKPASPTPTAPEQFWNAKDVASFLKTSRGWVYQRPEAGLIPCMKIGGLLRFNPIAIRAWALGAPPIVGPVHPRTYRPPGAL